MKTNRNAHLKFRLAASIAPQALFTGQRARDAILEDPMSKVLCAAGLKTRRPVMH